VEVDTTSGLADLCVGRRPGGSGLEVSLERLVSMFVLKVEINHNVLFGDLDEMLFWRCQSDSQYLPPDWAGVLHLPIDQVVRLSNTWLECPSGCVLRGLIGKLSVK
jgi:hypothetical protein